MMRFYLTFVFLVCSGVLFAQNPTITGRIHNIKNDTLFCQYCIYVSPTEQNVHNDTIIAKNGYFTYDIKNGKYPARVMIMPKDYILTKYRTYWANPIQFCVLPDEKLKIEVKSEGYKVFRNVVKGSDFNKDFAKFVNNNQDIKDEHIRINNSLDSLAERREKSPELWERYGKLNQEFNDRYINYIKENPTSMLSAYLLTSVSLDDFSECSAIVSETVKSGDLKVFIDISTKQYNDYKQVKEAEERTKAGTLAPDFTLKDINDHDFKLSSLRGSYVVLDFWGTWCGWCIKGIPEMKKYYDRYKDKVKFVSIDNNDTKEEWKKAVADYKMNWINLFNEKENKVPEKYGVMGYPTKLIINPDGIIIYLSSGEKKDFYEKLDSLW